MGKWTRWTWLACVPALAGNTLAAEDPAALQRGARTVVEVCTGCHDLKYIKYGDLLKIGIPKAEVDTMRGDKLMSDPLRAQMAPNDAMALFNTVPPDLSLMAHAREGGSAYIQELLTGFYNDPSGNLSNHAFPGIKMPDVLGVAQADPAARQEINHKAADVAAFLEWTADPNAAARIRMGYGVLVYVFVLTILFYLLKKKTWRRLGHSSH